MADVKGDLAGMSQPDAMSTKLAERLALIGAPSPAFAAMPVVFWDVFGAQGHPLRATVSDLGRCCYGAQTAIQRGAAASICVNTSSAM